MKFQLRGSHVWDKVSSLLQLLSRKQTFAGGLHSTTEENGAQLRRCLGTFEVTALGLGSTLGIGIYILSGQVARNLAGPGIVVSFTIAAVIALLSGMCYAEFSSRIPKTGSAYTFTYVAVGEFIAFIIGWNMVLEMMISSACGARAITSYIDSILPRIQPISYFNSLLFHTWYQNSTAFNATEEAMFFKPDLIAAVIVMLFVGTMMAGIKTSSRLNLCLTALNLSAVVFIVLLGSFYAELKNWHNFAPYGMKGILSGASVCFFSYMGFDTIATLNEEAHNPAKTIPRSIVATIGICFLANIGVATTITMMEPYYKIPLGPTISAEFESHGASFAGYIIAAGIVTALAATLLCSLLPTSRILLAMSQDGILPPFVGHISARTDTPNISMLLSGIVTATISFAIDLEGLVEMVSIGTLMAYSLVAICVLIMRYRPHQETDSWWMQPGLANEKEKRYMALSPSYPQGGSNRYPFTSKIKPSSGVERSESVSSRETVMMKLEEEDDDGEGYPQMDVDHGGCLPTRLANKSYKRPDRKTYKKAKRIMVLLFSIIIAIAVLSVTLQSSGQHGGKLRHAEVGEYGDGARYHHGDQSVLLVVQAAVLIVLVPTLLAGIGLLSKIPSNQNRPDEEGFKTPASPLLPFAAVAFNTILMVQLSTITWIRFIIWLVVGLTIYFTYGIWHSKAECLN